MPCGVCGTAGHNSRTCAYNASFPGAQSGSSTPSVKLSYKVYGSAGHNSRTCEKSEAKRPPSPRPGYSGRKSKEPVPEPIVNIKRSFSTNAASLPVDDIRDLVSTIREIKEGAKKSAVNNGECKRTVQQKTSNNETGDGRKAAAVPSSSKGKVAAKKEPEKKVNDGEVKRMGQQKTSNSETGDGKKAAAVPSSSKGKVAAKNEPEKELKNLDVPTRSKKSGKAPLGINWLNSEALGRLENGPTNGDGPGYIYMYRESDSKEVGDKDSKLMYKIGRSKNLPEKRVREQERKNKADYDIVFSVDTPHNVLTEGVIHKQLEAYHSPKESGDGRTEWFMGRRDNFEETIKKAVREVKFAFPEEKK